MACLDCGQKLQNTVPQDRHSAFVNACLLGAGAAVVGMVLYAAVGAITGWLIGYVSLAVGWLVATAMMKASGGLGGMRYQVVAALLTYAAVSTAAVPIALWQQQHQKAPVAAAQSGSGQAPQVDASEDLSDTSAPPMSLAKMAGTLLIVGLASPFMELGEGFGGVIGLFILFVGIRIAWKMTAGASALDIMGPF